MKTKIQTDAAPAAIGPYSQAVRVPAGDMIFCSGQIGLDPRTGLMVEGGVLAEARCALENLRAVLGAAGVGFEHVVRTTVFLADMADFADVNKLYEEYFEGVAPARAAVEAAGLPKGARFEITAIAVAG